MRGRRVVGVRKLRLRGIRDLRRHAGKEGGRSSLAKEIEGRSSEWCWRAESGSAIQWTRGEDFKLIGVRSHDLR